MNKKVTYMIIVFFIIVIILIDIMSINNIYNIFKLYNPIIYAIILSIVYFAAIIYMAIFTVKLSNYQKIIFSILLIFMWICNFIASYKYVISGNTIDGKMISELFFIKPILKSIIDINDETIHHYTVVGFVGYVNSIPTLIGIFYLAVLKTIRSIK